MDFLKKEQYRLLRSPFASVHTHTHTTILVAMPTVLSLNQHRLWTEPAVPHFWVRGCYAHLTKRQREGCVCVLLVGLVFGS